VPDCGLAPSAPFPICWWESRNSSQCSISLLFLPPYSLELNPKENLWDEIREKIFKNYALKSIDAVRAKLKQAILYIERNPTMVKSITTFPYIAKSSPSSVTMSPKIGVSLLAELFKNLKCSISCPLPFDKRDRRGRLELARHYGVPSPLIDFSLSPYVALFFAFNGVRPLEAQKGEHAAIYCLNIRALAGYGQGGHVRWAGPPSSASRRDLHTPIWNVG
jgi:hypothetical protein